MKRSLFLICTLVFFPVLIRAENPVDFSIRYFDKRIYHVSGNTGDPILVQATITNNSPSPYRFKLANERAFSVEFDIRTTSNRAVEPADTLMRRRAAGGVFFREISVESGESFSFVEDLRNYANLKEPGIFVVRARIYPELIRPELIRPELVQAEIVQPESYSGGQDSSEPGRVLESNRLSLDMRPPVIPGPGGTPLAVNVDSGTILTRERLAPDEVVEYLLTARQKGQWEKFFLYLNLKEILIRDPVRRRQWNAESEEGRQRMLERYREEMRQSVIDGDISAIPFEFDIERTSYNALEGTVVVLEKFRAGINYIERKRYTYYLKREESYWVIVDYVVSNLGTE
ncbi:MAG: hypothetical protein LBP20_03860 [Treponema sp.]|nr:hypothetical protein [Treponema sp.]